MGVYRGVVPNPLDVLTLAVRVALPEADAEARRLYGRTVPAPVSVRLILDTGSRLSSLTPEVLATPSPGSSSMATRGDANPDFQRSIHRNASHLLAVEAHADGSGPRQEMLGTLI